MGQKVHPKSLRLKINRTWDSLWYAPKGEYSTRLVQDVLLREEVTKRFKDAGLAKIEITRSADKLTVTLHTSKPGLVIGPSGEKIDQVRGELSKKFGNLEVVVKEVKKPDLDAALLGDSIARQIEHRVAYRRAAKQAIAKAMQAGAKGAKVFVTGRLNGVEIARSETFKEGNIPLHTLRSIIDYCEERANTMYGVIGVKVWVYKGDSFKTQKAAA